MNVQQLLSELLTIEAQMGALKARKDELRGDLDTEARRRWDEDGAVPSFKVARLGSATLAGCDKTTTEVVNPEAYAAWARGAREESVALVLRIPAPVIDAHADALASLQGAEGIAEEWQVHPAVLNGLVAAGRTDPDAGILIEETGEVVPGVRVSLKDPYLTVRLDPEAKRRALAHAAAEREQAMLLAEGVREAAAAIAREAVGATGGVTEAQRPPEPGSPEWYADLDDVFGPA
jgi:hypothetical protein